LSPGDTSCIPKVRPIRTPPKFADSVSELDPVRAGNGNEAKAAALKLAAAALDTVGDVFARFIVTAGIGSGLRGGEFTYTLSDSGYDFDLNRVKWTNDLQVSGSMRWEVASGNVTANVQLRQGGKDIGTLAISWNDVRSDAVATLTGTIHNQMVKATRIAP
jgi:hypothetical protein